MNSVQKKVLSQRPSHRVMGIPNPILDTLDAFSAILPDVICQRRLTALIRESEKYGSVHGAAFFTPERNQRIISILSKVKAGGPPEGRFVPGAFVANLSQVPAALDDLAVAKSLSMMDNLTAFRLLSMISEILHNLSDEQGKLTSEKLDSSDIAELHRVAAFLYSRTDKIGELLNSSYRDASLGTPNYATQKQLLNNAGKYICIFIKILAEDTTTT